MNKEAKNALDTIKTMLGASAYPSDADNLCIGVIENLMKRSVADYKQYLKDQQENATEMWRLVDIRKNGEILKGDYATREEAESWINARREAWPNFGYYNYEPMLFRHVIQRGNGQ